MTELFPKILAGCIVALFGWLLKMSYDQRRFRSNCLTEIKIKLSRLEEQVKDAKSDIKSLFDRLNNHINGSTK